MDFRAIFAIKLDPQNPSVVWRARIRGRDHTDPRIGVSRVDSEVGFTRARGQDDVSKHKANSLKLH